MHAGVQRHILSPLRVRHVCILLYVVFYAQTLTNWKNCTNPLAIR